MSFAVSPSPATLPPDERALLRRQWGLFLVLGLVAVLAGLLAVGATLIATLATVVFFGVLLVIAGIAEVIHAFMVRNLKSFALHILAAALYLIVGVFMLEDPGHAARILTLLLAASFLVGGLFRILFSLSAQFPAWPWVLLNGVVDLILGILIFSGWPETSYWVIGLFVGIDLLFHGWSWVILALSLRTFDATPTA
jgi:uncharacterized membrane protein HdeD (DUF308 family)